MRPIAAVTGREPRGLHVTARSGRSVSEGPDAGGGGSPGLHGAKRRKTGEPPGGWFRRGRCEPHIREPPATPNSGAGLKTKWPAQAGPAMALAKGASPEWDKTRPAEPKCAVGAWGRTSALAPDPKGIAHNAHPSFIRRASVGAWLNNREAGPSSLE